LLDFVDESPSEDPLEIFLAGILFGGNGPSNPKNGASLPERHASTPKSGVFLLKKRPSIQKSTVFLLSNTPKSGIPPKFLLSNTL
jgi:hypothetical protein